MCSNCGTGEREWLAGDLAELPCFEGKGGKVSRRSCDRAFRYSSVQVEDAEERVLQGLKYKGQQENSRKTEFYDECTSLCWESWIESASSPPLKPFFLRGAFLSPTGPQCGAMRQGEATVERLPL